MKPLVAKVGGSLFDLPDLRDRLGVWMESDAQRPLYLVPGGGELANAIRRLDAVHALGEEHSHRLALRTMSLSAGFLGRLLGFPVVDHGEPAGCRFIIDADAWWRRDPLPLAHSWSVSSDSIAATLAQSLGGDLALLKSADLPDRCSWEDAAAKELVDAVFPAVIARCPLDVRWVNFRRDPKHWTVGR